MWLWLSMFNAIIGTFFYQRWIILEIIRGRIMVFARLLMVASAYIVRKRNFPLSINVTYKTLFLSTLRT